MYNSFNNMLNFIYLIILVEFSLLSFNIVYGLPTIKQSKNQTLTNDINNGIKHLSGDSDYRAVKLHWDWIKSDDVEVLRAFQVYYCELQAWGPHRCRTKTVTDRPNNKLVNNNRVSKSYTTNINGLRMATTYTFEVRPVEDNDLQHPESNDRNDRSNEYLDNENSDENVINGKRIILNTKGFSARATLCLPSVSEVDVETGPYFGGRISVENSEGKEKCSIEGEADSPRDTYTLRINHQECGSTVNETTVATFIIVQENLPILTHSTRRFLVLCTFQPDTLTVRAGINLPSASGYGSSQIEAVPYENMINEVRQQRQMRQLAPETVTERPVSHILIMVIFIICGVFGITVFLLRAHQKRLLAKEADSETLSVTSGSAETPFSDIDSISTTSITQPIVKPQDGDVFTMETTSASLTTTCTVTTL